MDKETKKEELKEIADRYIREFDLKEALINLYFKLEYPETYHLRVYDREKRESNKIRKEAKSPIK